MKNISVMIKPASSLCNMRCRYCFYADVSKRRQVPSFGIMEQETMERMLANLYRDLEDGDRITFAFQGGEPTLAGISFFKRFAAAVGGWEKRIRVSYALQTNGLALDEEWCRFLAEQDFLVGLSFDLLPEYHDGARVDEKNSGTYKRVLETMRLLKRQGVKFNVLCTLTNSLARHPQRVWREMERLDIQYIQFTPCLGDLDDGEENPYALTPQRFASFYTQLFSLWYADFVRGKYRSVKYFDDWVNLLAYGVPTACGIDGRCQPQLIVEADGGVYPCDFYCLDRYRLGNVKELTLKELYGRSAASPSKKREERPALCEECAFSGLCGGGCRRMQRETCVGKDGGFCGTQEFLKSRIRELAEIAKLQR